MGILLISPLLYPCKTGGVEIFNYHFARELAEKKMDIHLLTNCNKVIIDHENITIIYATSIYLHSIISVLPKLFSFLARNKKRIDLMIVPYTSNSDLVYPVILANKVFHIPYIVTIHGGGIHSWKFRLPHAYFFRNASSIIAVSDKIKMEYEYRTNKKITVIPPLIRFSESKIDKKILRAKFGFNVSGSIIIYVGSIKKIKGCDILLDAFIGLGREYIGKNEITLVIAGDGIDRRKLESKARGSDIGESIFFLGNIDHEKIPDLMKLSDIFVIPSLYEGTSLSLLEALYNGLPVIGSDSQGINSIIVNESNGLLFEKGNSEDLKNKLKFFIENPDSAFNMGQMARKYYFSYFHVDDMTGRYEKIINSTVRREGDGTS